MGLTNLSKMAILRASRKKQKTLNQYFLNPYLIKLWRVECCLNFFRMGLFWTSHGCREGGLFIFPLF